MSDFINTIDLLGDEAVAKALVNRTITEFNDDVITVVGPSAFFGCGALTRVNLPNVTSVDAQSFSGCSVLTSANLPSLVTTSMSTFSSCSKLEIVNIPRCESLGWSSFESCSALAFLDLPSVNDIGNSCFSGCSALKTIVLRRETTCTLGTTSAFSRTPFASGNAGGTLLVPRSFTTEYPNATNWSSIISGNANNRVLALEDYTVDGTITGAIDWDKLGG